MKYTIATLLAGLLVVLVAPLQDADPAPPNIIVVMADDMGPTKSFATLDLAGTFPDFVVRLDDPVVQPLMIPLGVIMLEIGNDSPPQPLLAEKDHSRKRFGFDASRDQREFNRSPLKLRFWPLQ